MKLIQSRNETLTFPHFLKLLALFFTRKNTIIIIITNVIMVIISLV